MRNLHRILRTGILAVALIAGAGALPAAQASAQAASTSHRASATSSPLSLSVGRVLKEPPGSDEPQSRYVKGGPSRERRFLGNEWSVDVWFGSGAESVKTVGELPALAIATLADHPDFADSPLYVVTDAVRRRLIAIPCWEIFRVYYAGAPRIATKI